jgi:hypothetical protein
MIVVLSGCVGCVSVNGHSESGVADPAGAVPDAISTHRLSPRKLSFTGAHVPPETYEDDGLVIVVGTSRHPVDGYARVDLWLPKGEHSRATKILASFRVRFN